MAALDGDGEPEDEGDVDGDTAGGGSCVDALGVGSSGDGDDVGDADDVGVWLVLDDADVVGSISAVSLASGVADASTAALLDGPNAPTRACSNTGPAVVIDSGAEEIDGCDGAAGLEAEAFDVSVLADGVEDAGAAVEDAELDALASLAEAEAVSVPEGDGFGNAPSMQRLGISLGSGVGSAA